MNSLTLVCSIITGALLTYAFKLSNEVAIAIILVGAGFIFCVGIGAHMFNNYAERYFGTDRE
jgi:hypothetical protein